MRRGLIAVMAALTVVVVALITIPSGAAGGATSAAYPHQPYPRERWGMGMAYDPASKYIVMFSGSNGANDTWTFSAGKWSPLNETRAPSARTNACMVWDSKDQYVLLFGGSSGDKGSGRLIDDTWEFHDGAWTELHPHPSPPPLYQSGCVYDAAAGDVVLFGGHGNGHGNDSTNETWAFSGGVWTRLEPVRSPISRFAPTMFYDSATQDVVLYGGWTDNRTLAQDEDLCVPALCPYLNDTWVFSNGSWTRELAHPSPPGHAWDSSALDGATGNWIVFGGQKSNLKLPKTTQNATWAYEGSSWVNLTIDHAPGPEFGGGMAYDAADGYDVLFGGLSATTVNALTNYYTWTYSDGVWTNITAIAG